MFMSFGVQCAIRMYTLMIFLPLIIVWRAKLCGICFLKTFMNIFFLQISGLGILIAGIVVLNDVADFKHFLDGRITAGPVVLIIAGLLIFVIAFLGCYGALKESPKLLMAVSFLEKLNLNAFIIFEKFYSLLFYWE